MFFAFSVKTSQSSGICNNINNLYVKLCVSDVVKILNVEVFNLMSRTNETIHIEWHERCKCKYKLDASAWNNKQRWNDDKCRYECKELIDEGVCDKWSISNPSNCECECDKSGDVGEYLDYENCKCRKKIVDELVEECTENIDEVKIAGITLARHKNMCLCSCTIYVALAVIALTITIWISAYFVYSRWYLKKILLVLSLVPILKQQFNELINGTSLRNEHQKLNVLLFYWRD